MNEIAEFFNQKAANWDKNIPQHADRINYLISLLNLKTNEKVLDVGCGTGILETYLPDNVEVVAVDFSSEMIKIAKQKFLNKNFQAVDFLDMPSDEKFDKIIMYNIFPHFLQPYKAFCQAHNLLKPNGQLLICHGEGRDTINGRHTAIHNGISIGLLPTEQLKQWMLPYFEISLTEDKENYFALLGTRREFV